MKTLKEYAHIVEQRLETLPARLPEGEYAIGGMPWLLSESMRYSLTAGGKRLRPSMFLACAEMLGRSADELLDFACAIEMIHTYSLIHDDLPGMDDDDYRRGRLTNHKVYGVGHAILAGDGLLNYAYECLMKNALAYPQNLMGHVRAADVIARRAGVSGMIAGQSIDLLSEHMEPEAQRLCYIHAHKTADLLTAPLLAAGCIAGADGAQMEALSRFGACVGLAFQIDDDLLDVEGDAQEMGKQTGMDAQRGKMTWPALFGVAQSRARSQELWSQAEDALGSFGERAWFLRAFAETLRNRKK